jgi:2-dehydropantoate 2-reductase
MWEKWCFIAAAAAATSFMRATVGDIMSAGMVSIPTELLSECASIATDNGFPPDEAGLQVGLSVLTTPGSNFTASMFRDIENGARIEADHILGDLLVRARPQLPLPLLRAAYAHLKCYEARRARESGGG